MNEITFWKIIKEIDWNKHSDYKKIKKELMLKFNPEEIHEIISFKDILISKLYKILDAHDDYMKASKGHGYGLGDDSFGDLISEIVGRGSDFYSEVSNSPEIAFQMARKHDFKESFSYCFPYESDYQMMVLSNYWPRIESVLNDISEKNWAKYNASINNNINIYKTIIQDSLDKKDIESLVSNKEKLKSLRQKISEEVEESIYDGIDNIINDYQTYVK